MKFSIIYFCTILCIVCRNNTPINSLVVNNDKIKNEFIDTITIDSIPFNIKKMRISDSAFLQALDFAIDESKECEFYKNKLPGYIRITPIYPNDTLSFSIQIQSDKMFLQPLESIKAGCYYRGFNVYLYEVPFYHEKAVDLISRKKLDKLFFINKKEKASFYYYTFKKRDRVYHPSSGVSCLFNFVNNDIILDSSFSCLKSHGSY